MTILALGLALAMFSVAGLAVDGTRAFLARRALQNSADAAALAGAGSLDVRSVYTRGAGDVDLDPAAARHEALAWLEQRGLEATPEIVAGRDEIVVSLRAEVATSWLGLVGIDRIPVAVRAAAQPLEGRAP